MSPQPPDTAGFELVPAEPFRLDLTAWTLRRQGHNALDRWDGREYRRTMALPTGAIDVRVCQASNPPRLDVELAGPGADEPHARREVEYRLRRLLGLDSRMEGFYTLAAADRELSALANRFRGMRPPRYSDLFETLANAIACQQVSLNVGIIVLNRLAERFGVSGSDGVAFPRPEDLLEQATPETLRELGFSTTKGRTLLYVAEASAAGELTEENLAALSDPEAISQLTEIRGIGRWSAEYTLLRGLGRLHIFPGDDVGAQRHLAQWLNLSRQPNYHEARAALERWRDYAGLIYLHLLLLRLYSSGS